MSRIEVGSKASVLVVTGALILGGSGVSQESPYAEMTGREIKALSVEQIVGYREGQGMGFALAAELNGHPGPKHVLEMSQELGLSLHQRAATEKVFESMQAAAVDLGREILGRERELDHLFATESLEEETLVRLTENIGRLQGRLRGVHLRAHLEMMKILSLHQRQQYVAMRGYSEDGHRHDPSRHNGG
jgi:hypothetical protein